MLNKLSKIYLITLILLLPTVFAAVESPIFKTSLYLLIIPIGFRATCYYFRGWYGKYIFGHPKGCAIAEKHALKYTGEWWIQKLHRYFLYGALVLLFFHFLDAVINLLSNNFHLYVSNIIEWLDVIFLSLYVFSCHSLRYRLGSGITCFSCALGGKSRYNLYKKQTWLNNYHGLFFWISIFTILALELYIRLLQYGIITDLRVF